MAGQDWNVTGEPPTHLKISDIPQKIRDLKSATKTIIQKEHVALGENNSGGQHLKGAARVYLDASVPSTDPEGSSLDTSGTSDNGRIAIATGGGASTGLTNTIKVYVATSVGIAEGWNDVRAGYAGTAVRLEMDNDVSILGRKIGEPSTTIDLIKANTDNVPEILVGAVLSEDTAPSTAAGIATKKYVDDENVADHPAYAGGESHVDGSGLIIKTGYQVISATSGTITFETPFPNAVVGLSTALKHTVSTLQTVTITDFTTADIDWTIGDSNMAGFWWIAIGY